MSLEETKPMIHLAKQKGLLARQISLAPSSLPLVTGALIQNFQKTKPSSQVSDFTVQLLEVNPHHSESKVMTEATVQ